MAKKFICTSTEPVAVTPKGKIRGFQLGTTYTFYGIKYANAKRFCQPEPVEAWEGIKDALSYGYIAPMISPSSPMGDLKVPHRFWPEDENCQYLNIWTQSIDPSAKKPVMLWIHGGGFTSGSSIEMVAYDGDNLSRAGDVVVVSLNHRLNIFGFLDMSDYGEEYKNSANAGMADIVMALRWINENIACFGGDPENVTIFGQSGGGGKVMHLLQTPSANGLFHKAIIQSGVMRFGPRPNHESAKAMIEAMVKELGIDDPRKLACVPAKDLIKACNKVSPALSDAGYETGWAPVADGSYIGDPVNVTFNPHSFQVPTMVGSVFGEFAFGVRAAGKNRMTQQEKKEILSKKYGGDTEKLLALFQKAYPDKDILDAIFLDSAFRLPTIDYLDDKAKVIKAPLYSYQFAYDLPVDDGTPAWHCAEIPFAFHNTEKVPVTNEPGVSEKLEEEISGAWINFARTGNPNNPALPQWDTYTTEHPVTMVFDRKSEAKTDYDRELVKLHWKIAPLVWHARKKK